KSSAATIQEMAIGNIQLPTLDRGLIPRSRVGRVPNNPRQPMQSAIEDNQAKCIAEFEERNAQIEAANEALGKLSGSCTIGTHKSPTPPRRRRSPTIPNGRGHSGPRPV